MNLVDWYRWDGADLLVKLKLQPRSSRNAFAGQQNGRMRVCITTPPVDGKANNHLTVWLAKQFGVAKTAVCIETGRNAPIKRVRVRNPARIPNGLQITPND